MIIIRSLVHPCLPPALSYRNFTLTPDALKEATADQNKKMLEQLSEIFTGTGTVVLADRVASKAGIDMVDVNLSTYKEIMGEASANFSADQKKTTSEQFGKILRDFPKFAWRHTIFFTNEIMRLVGEIFTRTGTAVPADSAASKATRDMVGVNLLTYGETMREASASFSANNVASEAGNDTADVNPPTYGEAVREASANFSANDVASEAGSDTADVNPPTYGEAVEEAMREAAASSSANDVASGTEDSTAARASESPEALLLARISEKQNELQALYEALEERIADNRLFEQRKNLETEIEGLWSQLDTPITDEFSVHAAFSPRSLSPEIFFLLQEKAIIPSAPAYIGRIE